MGRRIIRSEEDYIMVCCIVWAVAFSLTYLICHALKVPH